MALPPVLRDRALAMLAEWFREASVLMAVLIPLDGVIQKWPIGPTASVAMISTVVLFFAAVVAESRRT